MNLLTFVSLLTFFNSAGLKMNQFHANKTRDPPGYQYQQVGVAFHNSNITPVFGYWKNWIRFAELRIRSEAEEQNEITSHFSSTEHMRKKTAFVMQRSCWETRATYFNKAVPIQTEGDASKFSIWLKEGAISLVEQRVSQSQVTEALPHRSNLHLCCAH